MKTSSALLRQENEKAGTSSRIGQALRRYTIRHPLPEDAADIGKKQVLKYQKLARLATHTNDWLRKIANADLDKSLYENRITTAHASTQVYRTCHHREVLQQLDMLVSERH